MYHQLDVMSHWNGAMAGRFSLLKFHMRYELLGLAGVDHMVQLEICSGFVLETGGPQCASA